MEREFEAMIAGHVCFDVIPYFPPHSKESIQDLLPPGKLVQVGDAKLSAGGPVSNTGIILKTLGCKVCFCASVGDDDFGRMTMEYLQRSGSAKGIRILSGIASSYTIVLAVPGIDRIFLHNPGSNNCFSIENMDINLLKHCRCFHFGYPPLMRRMYEMEGIELKKIFQVAKDAGVTTSCDMALPDPDSKAGKVNWRNILKNVLPYIDIFLPSIEETFFMLEPEEFLRMKKKYKGAELIDYLELEDYAHLADRLLQLGSRMVGLKAGHRGFYFKSASETVLKQLGAAQPSQLSKWADRELWCPAFHADNLASETGAGDAFIAGFLTGLLRDKSLEKTLKIATCVAWQNLQELDAQSGIRNWDETRGFLEKKMAINDALISSSSWKWNPDLDLWSGPSDRLTLS
jgi:sugar/nucleoside kinase (ribokinase family)